MNKIVNVYPTVPVYSLRVPVVGTILNAELSVGDILVCIYARAKVEEVLPSGKKVILNLNNYNAIIEDEIVEEKQHISNILVEEHEAISPEQIIEDVTPAETTVIETEPTEEVIELEQVEEKLVVEPRQQKNKNSKR